MSAIEPCPDCKTVPTPFTNGPWVVWCETCDWDDAPVPIMGVGLTGASAVERWNKAAQSRALELQEGEAAPPRCVNVHPPRPWESSR